MDKGEYIIGVFLDLTNINIIKSIRRMPCCGKKNPHQQKQYVYNNGTNSEMFDITC